MDDSPRPRIWDVVSAEQAAEWRRMAIGFDEALDAVIRHARFEEELETTRREIEDLPTAPPTQ
jgi:hypothetical protein